MSIDTKQYIRKLEQVNEDLRRRNGELYVALDEAGSAKRLTPIPDFPTRYVLLDRMVSIAAEVGKAWADNKILFEQPEGVVDQFDTDLLDQLEEAAMANRDYWNHVDAERRRRDEIAAKARATKEANKKGN